MIRPGSEVELSQLKRVIAFINCVLKNFIKMLKLEPIYTSVIRNYMDNKAPDCVVSQNLRISDCDLEWSITLVSRLRPVLLTLDSTSLLTVGKHDYCRGSLLPHHPPEVINGVWKWS